VTRLFLDSPCVIYYVERNPSYAARTDAVFDRIDAGPPQAVTSPITLAECLVVPIRLGMAQAAQDFTDVIVSGRNVSFVPLDAAIARDAADFRARYNLPLLDAFQVAAARAAACDAFLTNDRALRRVQEITILLLDDLEA
jgi:predicted nucleic acid-binding protein